MDKQISKEKKERKREKREKREKKKLFRMEIEIQQKKMKQKILLEKISNILSENQKLNNLLCNIEQYK